MSAEYRRDFIRLQGSFARMFDSMCETVGSQVPVDGLKRYLCRSFSEFEILLQDAVTTNDVMKAVRNESSLTDFAFFEEIADYFNLHQMKQAIRTYHSILDSFCQHTLDNHSYVRSFREDYPRYILSSDKIIFQLEWKAKDKTLKDIRNVLRMTFKHLADRVQIVVIGDGSVVVVCCAPRYLMEELVRLASESVHLLAEMGVVKLTVGGTEVTVEKVNYHFCTVDYMSISKCAHSQHEYGRPRSVVLSKKPLYIFDSTLGALSPLLWYGKCCALFLIAHCGLLISHCWQKM